MQPVHDLTGWWEVPDACFLWESAKIFRRTSSEHPHDYWVIYGSGACLASSCHSTTARYSPASGLLHFPAIARNRLGGPWRCVVFPTGPMLMPAGTIQTARQRGWLVGARWVDPEAAEAHYLHEEYGVMVRRSMDPSPRAPWVMGHGVSFDAWRIQRINETERYAVPPRPVRLLAPLPVLTLRWLPGPLTVARMPAASPLPALPSGGFLSITRTADELSLVLPSDAVPAGVTHAEPGWWALQVVGPLDFSLVGILSRIAAVLARAGVSIFSISTYDTDHILVKRPADAQRALLGAGYAVLGAPNEDTPAGAGAEVTGELGNQPPENMNG